MREAAAPQLDEEESSRWPAIYRLGPERLFAHADAAGAEDGVVLLQDDLGPFRVELLESYATALRRIEGIAQHAADPRRVGRRGQAGEVLLEATHLDVACVKVKCDAPAGLALVDFHTGSGPSKQPSGTGSK